MTHYILLRIFMWVFLTIVIISTATFNISGEDLHQQEVKNYFVIVSSIIYNIKKISLTTVSYEHEEITGGV